MTKMDTTAVDRIVGRVIRAWQAPGAAVAVVVGEEVYLQGYGVEELGGDDPVSPDTLFAIASATKAFTCTAIAMLVEEGKMAWDDPVRKHLPWFRLPDPVADANVTLRDLACHRTGMPRHDWLWWKSGWDREEIVRRYGLATSQHPFRAAYEYANIPYLAAGLVIEAASGLTWEQFIKARIFDPLGMTTANFGADEAVQSPDHSAGHHKRKGKVCVLPRVNLDPAGPAGSINASARDMLNWIRFQLANGEFEGNRLISAEKLLETRKPQVVVPVENPDKFGFDWGSNIKTYCLGWGTGDYRGRILVSHGGFVNGFVSEVRLIPAANAGLVALVNLADSVPVADIAKRVTDLLLGLPTRNWTADYKALAKAMREEERRKNAEAREKQPRPRGKGRPSLELRAYAGDYENPAYGSLRLTFEDPSLTLDYREFSVELKRSRFDTFAGKYESDSDNFTLKATFELDAEREVVSLRVLEPFEAEFRRVAVDFHGSD